MDFSSKGHPDEKGVPEPALPVAGVDPSGMGSEQKMILLRQYCLSLPSRTGQPLMVPEAELSVLADCMAFRMFDKGTQILAAGDTEEWLHLVVAGIVRRYFIRRGDQVTAQFAMEGQLAGSEVSFYSDSLSNYFLEAVTKTTMLSLPRTRFLELRAGSHFISRLVRMMMISFLIERARVDAWLRLDVRTQMKALLDSHPEYFIRIQHKLLATYLDVSPETFSRVKNEVVGQLVKDV
ncbi:Crp/Fnr family transcriptional regulator [Chitinophaga lutea]|nr:Crp/Fnr family transcriptional regulator [Chitinophaga lutea]